MPLLFKIFLLLFLTSGKAVKGALPLGEERADVATIVQREQPVQLVIETDPGCVEQVLYACNAVEKNRELARDISREQIGIVRLVLQFDNLTRKNRELITEILTPNIPRYRLQWQFE